MKPSRLPAAVSPVLLALIRVAAPRKPGGPAPDTQGVLERLGVLYPQLSLPVRGLLSTALVILDLSPFLMGRHLRRFRSLSPAQADRCLTRWETSRVRAVRQVAKVLVGLVSLAAWDDAVLQRAIGYRLEEHIEHVNSPLPSPPGIEA